MTSSTARVRAFRARQRALLLPAAGLADTGMLAAVEETLAALGLGPEDAAAGQLARAYPAAVDGAECPVLALARIGGQLLRVLTALQATPASRSRVPRRKMPERPSWLDQQREAHARASSRGI